ncbi:MAG: hypothetical protein KJ670_04265 [Alphaproteobacteria bacterium]|nr:hypothetical protein [Rhizobiaceae bacterium]MBU3962869.1 hypothetical protein [Alphaproteobacteria bacterium]MBU4087916.1 hypothetical protein [Alphaproteobacteria bacterium]
MAEHYSVSIVGSTPAAFRTRPDGAADAYAVVTRSALRPHGLGWNPRADLTASTATVIDTKGD